MDLEDLFSDFYGGDQGSPSLTPSLTFAVSCFVDLGHSDWGETKPQKEF